MVTMLNLHDQASVAEDYLAFVKLWHTVNGLYIWEFVTTFDYEWDVIRGRRRYLRTIWIYSLARVATLMAVVVNMIGLDTTRPINCQVWVVSELLFVYIAVASATLLIVHRTIAVWEKKKIVIVLAMGVWVSNLACSIHSLMQIRASWAPAQGICVLTDTDSSKHNIVATLAADVIILLIMLLGLFRLHAHARTSGLVHFLWKQGILWFLLATLAEVPPTVFIILNISAPFDLMFVTPAVVTVSIAATRMYRSLTKFRNPDISSSQDGPQNSGRIMSGTRQLIFIKPSQLNGKECATSEQYLESQAGHCSLSTKGDGKTVTNTDLMSTTTA